MDFTESESLQILAHLLPLLTPAFGLSVSKYLYLDFSVFNKGYP